MKVGLLTFHSAHNYGAVLQAFATQEIVKSFGYDIEVIDYRPSYLIEQHVFPNLKHESLSIRIKLLFEGLLCLFWRFKRRKGFAKFISSKLCLSSNKHGNHPFSYDDNYDVYVMGSDQVWNTKFTKGFDQIYWGNFKTSEDAIKISYAASMSHYKLNDIQKQQMEDYLQNFKSISVREEELKHFISDNFEIETTKVLDPTFLLDKPKWKNFSTIPKTRRKYVLVYSVDLRGEVMRVAKSVAKQLGIGLIELTMGVDKKVLKNRYQTATPEEYVGLFENAECIITSSFHGTAFSIIFDKPFYSIAHGTDKDTRQKTILDKLGLADRFISRTEIPDFQTINYDEPKAKLNVLVNESIAYLKNNLSVKV